MRSTKVGVGDGLRKHRKPNVPEKINREITFTLKRRRKKAKLHGQTKNTQEGEIAREGVNERAMCVRVHGKNFYRQENIRDE